MHHIGYLLTPGFQLLTIGTQTVFEFANLVAGEPFYQVQLYSLAGGIVPSSFGVGVETRPLLLAEATDSWIVAGMNNPLLAEVDLALVDFLRSRASNARRMVGLCTGGFILAEAGLLDGRRVTTHWAYAQKLQALYPTLQVEQDRIYVVDDGIWTSAGMTAGFDLALGMVEKDLGAEVARSVAHKLVMHQRRAGGQSQHSEMLQLGAKSDRIQNALNYANRHLNHALSVEELAEVAHLSPRQFTRVFCAETGQSPAKAIEKLRLEAARTLLEQSSFSLDVIAKETGFRDRRHLREAFIRGFGAPPQAMRRESRL
jgi:transcriptional regulator GlxA family with amidase domain